MDVLLTTYLPDLLSGLWVTTQITAIAFTGSIGTALYLAYHREKLARP